MHVEVFGIMFIQQSYLARHVQLILVHGLANIRIVQQIPEY